MSTSDAKSPAELRAERFDSLRSRWDGLRSRATLAHLHDGIEDTAGKIEGLPHQIAKLRKRGYRYSRAWEAQAETLRESWPERRREARRILREQARDMDDLAKDIEELCDHSRLSDSGLDRLDDKLDRLQSQITSAESNVRGAFDSLNDQIYQLQREFDSVEFMLDSLDTAAFDLYPDENGVAACEATWTNHPDEPKGILFLNDGRLVFEQREKKAKKKVLFITIESELVQDKLWETPVGNVAELEAEDKRKFLRRKELLHLRFREYSSGLHGDVTLRLENTTNEEWAGLIKRVQSGEIEADRYDAPARDAAPLADAAPPTPPKEIPTKCPACGGKLPPLVKGMREIVCEYCGTSVRL
jgi:predicted  nucleic acid-binding Zn-ribbon protein